MRDLASERRAIRTELVFEAVAGNFRSVDILIEEPIHLPVVIQIHLLRHVFFNSALQILSRHILVVMRFNEILHHRHETLVAAVARIEHHPPQHVQNVSAFGIYEELVGGVSLAAAQAETLRDRTNGVRLQIVRLRS